jgi:hypothetical protein
MSFKPFDIIAIDICLVGSLFQGLTYLFVGVESFLYNFLFYKFLHRNNKIPDHEALSTSRAAAVRYLKIIMNLK